MRLFAGIDGGGTHTRALIVGGEGREIARGEAPGAVATAAHPEAAADAVTQAIGDAMEAAALELITRDASLDEIGLPLDGLWAGLAGAGNSEASRAVTEVLSGRRLAHRLTVGTDVRAAYEDAFPDDDGVLLIAGTGSIAWGTVDNGPPIQVGGWGQLLGDEGSGYWIGLRGLQHVMTEHDGRSPVGTMTAALTGACDVGEPDELVPWVNQAAKGDIAALAPLVISAAAAGDSAAEQIVSEAVDALSGLVQGVVSRRVAPDVGVRVVLWGGLIAADGPLAPRVSNALGQAGFEVVERAVDPTMGAARLALRG